MKKLGEDIGRRSHEIQSLFWLALVILLSFPIPIRPLTPGIDPSWMAGINWASAHNLVFGRDAMFTYGPLGFSLFPVDCFTENWRWFAVMSQLCLYGLWWLSVGLVLFHIKDVVGQWLFAITSVVATLKPDGGGVVTLAVLGFLVVGLRRNSLALAVLAAVLAGGSLFIKFNLGVSCCAAVLGAWLLMGLREPRRLAAGKGVAILGSLVATVPAVNWGCGGGWSDLVSFFRYSTAISADYSSQMSLSGPGGPALYLLAVLALLAACVGSGVVCKSSSWSTAALLVLPAFFEYKRAVTRMDFYHWIPGICGMLAIVALLLVVDAGKRERQVIRWVVGLCAFAGFAAIQIWRPSTEFSGVVALLVLVGLILAGMVLRSCGVLPGEAWNERLRAWFTGVALTCLVAVCAFLAGAFALPAYPASLRLPAGPTNILRLVHLESWLTQPPKPRVEIPARMLNTIGQQSVDAYQTEIATVLIYKLNYQPRFMFQSYQAYSPLLDSVAAQRFAASDGPRFIVYSYHSAIDETHPWMVDPLTWLEIYRWYDLADRSEDLLLLRRRPEPRWQGSRAPGAESVVAFGERVLIPEGLPAHRLLKARIELTLAGKLARFLFRVIPPTIKVEFVDGTVQMYRLVWLNGVSGFLVTDLPQDSAADTSFLEGTGDTGARAVTFLGNSRVFSPQIHLQWQEIPIEAEPPR